MSTKVNVGLIGVGRIGQLHCHHLAHLMPDVKVSAVCDFFADRARDCAAQYGIPVATDDFRTLLDNQDIDAVFVCSSTDTHAEIISAAADAGKHVFSEKPIALDLVSVDRALVAVERAGVKLQVGFNRRFDCNYARVRQALKDGEIGTPHILHIVSRDPSPPPIEYIRISGGIFLDMTIHDFDMARFLIGAEAEELSAIGGVMIDEAIGREGDIDTTIITLRFENGVIGTIDNSRQAVYGYDQRVEVLGSQGCICTANAYPNSAVVSTADTVHRDLPLELTVERYRDAYLAEKQAFVDSILNDTEPPVTGMDGRAPVVMAYAARKSYEEHRPVNLSEIGSRQEKPGG